MRAAVLSIGTELTRGEIVNTNASWLAETITTLGLEVATIETTPDDRLMIEDVLRRLGDAHRMIVCTGGLGPTTDDITRDDTAPDQQASPRLSKGLPQARVELLIFNVAAARNRA